MGEAGTSDGGVVSLKAPNWICEPTMRARTATRPEPGGRRQPPPKGAWTASWLRRALADPSESGVEGGQPVAAKTRDASPRPSINK